MRRAFRTFQAYLSGPVTALHLHTLEVAEVSAQTADSRSLKFVIPAKLEKEFLFQPGQYLTLAARLGGREVRRTYSIHSAAGAEPAVLVKRIDGGVFSGHVMNGLSPGASLSVMPPAGSFGEGLDFSVPSSYYAAAAGSGVTPVISIIESALEGNPRTRAALVYGNRAIGSIIFRERLAGLKDRHLDRFQLVHVLTGEKTDNPLFRGRLDAVKFAEIFANAANPRGFENLLVCGPDGMADAFENALASCGHGARPVRRERFNAPASSATRKHAPAAGAGACELVIVMDGVRRTISCAAGSSVLEAARDAGLDVPFSCQGGVCSTCRAQLVDGEAQMDVNYALVEEEIGRGLILTCQARPSSATITVDYDGAWVA